MGRPLPFLLEVGRRVCWGGPIVNRIFIFVFSKSLGTVVDFESFAHSMGDPEMYEKTMKNHTNSVQFSFRLYKKKILGKIMGKTTEIELKWHAKRKQKQRK